MLTYQEKTGIDNVTITERCKVKKTWDQQERNINKDTKDYMHEFEEHSVLHKAYKC